MDNTAQILLASRERLECRSISSFLPQRILFVSELPASSAMESMTTDLGVVEAIAGERGGLDVFKMSKRRRTSIAKSPVAYLHTLKIRSLCRKIISKPWDACSPETSSWMDCAVCRRFWQSMGRGTDGSRKNCSKKTLQESQESLEVAEAQAGIRLPPNYKSASVASKTILNKLKWHCINFLVMKNTCCLRAGT